MIDLKALEAKVDKMLENETAESLSNWLFKSRLPNINTIIGDGEFVSMPLNNYSTSFMNDTDAASYDEVEINPLPYNRFAA